MLQGYIKLHRSSQDNILYFAETFTKWQAWQDMILIANHKKGALVVRWNIIDLNRGQLWHSEETLCQRRKRSRGKVRRFLEYLETIQQIEQHKSKVKSVITIVNYDKYQWNDTTDSTTDGHQTVQQTDTNKNDKKEKNEKKFVPPSLEEVQNYFTSNGYSKEVATRAFNWYKEAEWHDSYGKPVKNRKQKMNNVWFRDDNRIKYTSQDLIKIAEWQISAREEGWEEAVKAYKEKRWVDLVKRAVAEYNK